MIDEDDNEVIRDHLDIFQTILEQLKKNSTMAIQDDYPGWKDNGYSRSNGKLLMIDPSDYNTQHIFFDDNADAENECIVDVRDLITGEEIDYEKFMDMYVVKVSPHRAILEPEYFIKCIEQCEANRQEEIQRVEAGIEDEDPLPRHVRERASVPGSDETEWEKIQKLPEADYLMRTVLPVLYQGMRVVDLERPAAPLEYLALYLLKH